MLPIRMTLAGWFTRSATAPLESSSSGPTITTSGSTGGRSSPLSAVLPMLMRRLSQEG